MYVCLHTNMHTRKMITFLYKNVIKHTRTTAYNLIIYIHRNLCTFKEPYIYVYVFCNINGKYICICYIYIYSKYSSIETIIV